MINVFNLTELRAFLFQTDKYNINEAIIENQNCISLINSSEDTFDYRSIPRSTVVYLTASLDFSGS